MKASSVPLQRGLARSSTPGVAHRASRRRARVRAAADGFCRDKVSAPKGAAASTGQVFKIEFLGMGGQAKVVECPDNMYILDAAERAGVDLPATCRGGICGACVGRVVEGKIDSSDIDDISFTLSDEEVADGMALLCMSRATTDVKIETQCDWGYSLGVGAWKGASGRFSASPDPLMGTTWEQK